MKNIILTGATRGLGLAIAKRLKKEGFKIITTGRKITDDLSDLINEKKLKGKVVFYPFDFLEFAKISDFVKKIVKENGRPYGLINNAALGHDGILATMHETQILELINVNLVAPIIFTKYVSRSMLIEKEGRIINISSIIGSTGFNGLSVYGATKSGLTGFTKSLSRELGKGGVTVNTIAPGYMATDMTKGLEGERLKTIKRRSPLDQLTKVEDVAGSVLFLLGEDASSMTGACITVDSGSTA